MSVAAVLAGASLAEAVLLAALGLLALRLARDFGENLFRKTAAALLLIIGLGWFTVLLFG